MALYLAATLASPLACSSVPPAERASPDGATPEIDRTWLRAEVERVFQVNRVRADRRVGAQWFAVVFHAPSAETGPNYPEPLPGWLQWAYRVGWTLKQPWDVQYPHQWSWDSAAHAIALSHLDPDLAREEIWSVLYTQREDGFIPHMVWNHRNLHWVDRLLQALYPSFYASPYVQTPAIADAIEAVYRTTSDLRFVEDTLPYLQRYYQYLARERDRDGDGLPQIIHSYESGMDRSPAYDPVYGERNDGPAWQGPMFKLMLRQRTRGWDLDRIFAHDLFQVKDVFFDSVYAQNLAALARLLEATGRAEEAVFWRGRAEQTETAILSQMYDAETGLFFSLDARGENDRQVKVKTIASLMPLMLDSIPKEQVDRLVRDYLANPEEFWTPYPVPAEPLSSVDREPEGHVIWRGRETFIYGNWYLARALRKQANRFPEHAGEYRRLADEITLKSYQLVRQHGFREFYDAVSGEGQGAAHFGPTTLVLDMVYNMGSAGATGPGREAR